MTTGKGAMEERVGADMTANDGNAHHPYQPPRVAWEERLDVSANLAAACDKVSTDDPQCAASAGS